ncbi:predicted protein [Plenodomus lingam JN3]|uniref:Predicted protein n=1 Tax=Leptosphaeria maculans (strain JN3 / isolate v23.1.3 / race Av1-4-5-6-7-8) TaxID=985895 RepID=E4ZU17_LEPMJ|nr:predicted protein [Plenodomus lingam JN3]CBX94727.1 predicted protein [Plenodomus lingam JN3]
MSEYRCLAPFHITRQTCYEWFHLTEDAIFLIACFIFVSSSAFGWTATGLFVLMVSFGRTGNAAYRDVPAVYVRVPRSSKDPLGVDLWVRRHGR